MGITDCATSGYAQQRYIQGVKKKDRKKEKNTHK